MIKLFSNLNYCNSGLNEKFMLKPTGESMFFVCSESLSCYLIVAPLDLIRPMLNPTLMKTSSKFELCRINLSKEEHNRFVIAGEGKLDLSTFQGLLENSYLLENL